MREIMLSIRTDRLALIASNLAHLDAELEWSSKLANLLGSAPEG
jgi:hypothetical protein